MNRWRKGAAVLMLAGLAAMVVIVGSSKVAKTAGWGSDGYRWITAQGDTNATLHSVVAYTGAGTPSKTIGSFFANDSIADTLSVWISPRFSIRGAKSVWIFARDSTPTATTAYLDTSTTGFFQVSNDTINWLTLPLTASTLYASHDTALVNYIGDLTARAMSPAKNGGLGVVARITAHTTDANAVLTNPDVIPWNYGRLQLRWTGHGSTDGGVRQRRFVYGLRVNATVVYDEHQFRYQTKPTAGPR